MEDASGASGAWRQWVGEWVEGVTPLCRRGCERGEIHGIGGRTMLFGRSEVDPHMALKPFGLGRQLVVIPGRQWIRGAEFGVGGGRCSCEELKLRKGHETEFPKRWSVRVCATLVCVRACHLAMTRIVKLHEEGRERSIKESRRLAEVPHDSQECIECGECMDPRLGDVEHV